MFYVENFNGIDIFMTTYRNLHTQRRLNEGRPRKLEQIQEKLFIVRQCFAAFINQALQVKFPGKSIQFFDNTDAGYILDCNPKTLDDIFSLMTFDTQGKFVNFSF